MHSFKRHKFNIFPEAGAEDFARLVDDMRANGYDAAMPITLYQGAILDGWNRYRAASSLTTGALGAMNTRRAGSSRRVLVAAITANVYSSHVGSFGPRFIASLAAT